MFWSQWGVLPRYYITLVNLTNDPLHCLIFRTETTRNHGNIEKKLPKNVNLEVVKSLLLTWSHWAATIKVTAANKYGRNKCTVCSEASRGIYQHCLDKNHSN